MLIANSNKSYSYYKPSGIEWIGEIPDGWKYIRLKHISYMKGRIGWQGLRQSEFTDEGPYLITGMNFKDGIINWDEVYHISEERYNEAPEIQLKEKDVLITKDGTIGKVLYVDYLPGKASLNSHLLVLRPYKNEYYPKYMVYQFLSNPFLHYIEIYKTGTTFYGITQTAVGNYIFILPPIPEQQAIADFLDRETARINRIIEKQTRLIELLKEKRSALITQAVTRGLDPNAKMKDSGVEWIGEIPEGWEVRTIKKSLTILTDFTANGSFASLADNVEYLSEGFSRLIRLTDLRCNLTNDGIYVSESAHNFLKKSELFGDEILIANVGAYTGLVCQMPYINGKATLGPNMYLLKFKEIIYNKYIYYLLSNNSFFNILQIKATASAQPKMNKRDVKEEFIIIPTFSEQQAIADFLDRETDKIDKLISKIEKQIDLLNEYKQSLITAAVTGKIDVRNVQ